ncbi:MAG: aminotransferase class V-fold PLP-dependent enzyme [Spirochaetota bacterium]|nr:aminotransferase class V-fold PLP-dependent enzyme [Spirochaetota bacterium]
MIGNYTDDFPILENYLHLDHAAVGPIPKRAVQEGSEFLEHVCHHGHLSFESWLESRAAVKQSLARMMAAEASQIALTKNTSDGLLKLSNALDWKAGDNVILFNNEFPANVYPWTSLSIRDVDCRFVPEKDGKYDLEDVKSLIDENTRLMAVSQVEFSTGYRQDLVSLGKLCSEHGILFVVDAIQGLGAVPLDVNECQIDFLSAGGHKWLMSGFGMGCLYARDSATEKLSRLIHGYGAVEKPMDFLNYNQPLGKGGERFEDGMFNVTGIKVMEASLGLLLDVGIENIYRHLLELGDYLAAELKSRGYELLSPVDKDSRSGILSFHSKKHNSDKLHKIISDSRIIVSNRRGCIRVSPHFYNTREHLDQLLNLLPEG